MSTGIEWTDETWNPTSGCTKVSEGCDHCYAERITNRFGGPGAFDTVVLHPDRLEKPLHWRKPRRVFVDSMSDLFHDDVPDGFIAEVFGVMAVAGRVSGHQFQVLTKRPGRMASLVDRQGFRYAVASAAFHWAHDRTASGVISDDIYPESRFTNAKPTLWPLPNVWLGTSVENQKWADVRIPKLLDTPAAVRFLSCEPLLGPIDLTPFLLLELDGQALLDGRGIQTAPIIPWVIVGGESGPDARPMHPEWALSIRDQCVAAGVPFFFKQWGEWAEVGPDRATHLMHAGEGQVVTRESATRTVPVGSHGERTEDLVDRGHPYWVRIARVGKKRAGRELYGRTWDEMPEQVRLAKPTRRRRK